MSQRTREVTVESGLEMVSRYTAPDVVDYGDLTALTAGSADGAYTDADFPVKTPKSDITFSG
jgi:hypothetical protein